MIIEPFRVDGDGELGFAIVFEDGTLEIMLMDEWEEWANDHKGFSKKDATELLKELAEFSNGIFWEKPAEVPLPSRPEPNWDGDIYLIRDLQRELSDMVQLLDERHYIAISSWVICSYLREVLTYAPRLLFYATTASGKSQALRYLCAASYRGHDYSNPSVAALYRDIEAWHPTICVDSWQRIDRNRAQELEWIWEKGFARGGTVPRVNDSGKVDRFAVHSWLAVASKKLPKWEDLQNRSLMVPMATCDEGFIPKDEIDMEAFADLQGRLLTLRLAVLRGEIDIKEKVCEAKRLAREFEPRLQFRPKNIASTMLVPSLIWNEEDGQEAILEMIADSQSRAMQSLKDCDDAQVFHALCAIVYGMRPRKTLDGDPVEFWKEISTRDVADQYNQDLIERGDDKKERTPTKRINTMLQVLGFDFRSGAGNKSYFNPETSEAVYKRNLLKFGPRGT